MNEDLHFTHFFHETLQQFPYPKYKTWKPASSFINKHKSSTRKEQKGGRWNREEGEDIKFGLGFSLIYDMDFIKTINIFCYIIGPKGCQLASQVDVYIFWPYDQYKAIKW